MKVPLFKDSEIIFKKYEPSEKILKYFEKQKIQHLLQSFIDVNNDFINKVFVCEKNNLIPEFKKIIMLHSFFGTYFYCLDHDHNVYQKFIKDLNVKDFSDLALGELVKSFIKVTNPHKESVSPYLLNDKIKSDVSHFFNKSNVLISEHIHQIDSGLGFRYKRIYSQSRAYFIKYIQNKFFYYVDKELFKELYSYHLHYKPTPIYKIMKYAKKYETLQYENFLRFKKEHNFLSMAYCEMTHSTFIKSFSNYNSIIKKTATILNTELATVEALRGKHYNDYLYFKTPQKLISISSKIGLPITSEFTIEQARFLNMILRKKNTFIKPHEAARIINNPALLKNMMTTLEIRKEMGFARRYESVEDCILTTKEYFNKYTEVFIEYVGELKRPKFSNFKNKELNIELTNISPELVMDSIRNYVLSDDKEYSNLQYWKSLIEEVTNLSSSKQFYILKENRQKHIIVLNYRDFEVLVKNGTVTPRIYKKLCEFILTDEFKAYYTENLNIICNLSDREVNLKNNISQMIKDREPSLIENEEEQEEEF